MVNFVITSENNVKTSLINSTLFSLVDISGLDAPAYAMNFSRTGENYYNKNSGFANQRNIVITLQINSPAYQNRLELYRLFPVNSKVKFEVIDETLSVFEEGYVESFNVNHFELGQKAVISILCNDPFFTASKEVSITFTDITDLFEFPFDVPEQGVVMSEYKQGATVTINPGTAESGLIAKINVLSAISEFRLINVTTGEFIGFKGYFEQGDTIDISTVFGDKKAYLTHNGVTTSLISSLITGSKWLVLKPTDNEINYTCTGSTSNADVALFYQRKYQGV